MDKSEPEVQKHLKQAHHNFRFYCEVHSKLPHLFFDWKITVLFYTATHALRAILTERDVVIGNSHFDLRNNINPNNKSAKSPVKKYCYDAYVILYTYSMTSRYKAFLTTQMKLKALRDEFEDCKKAIGAIDSYLKASGYPGFLSIQEAFKFEEKK